MDKISFYKQLLDRYVNNTATAEELEIIDHLIGKEELDDLLTGHMAESWEKEVTAFEKSNMLPSEKPARFKLWLPIAVAAVLALIIFGVWLYTSQHSGANQDAAGPTYANDIRPGKNQATLTFANGKKINLSGQKSGIVIGADLQYNDRTAVNTHAGTSSGSPGEATISTPRGGTYQITLSDGTKVWLNAASSLTYNPVLNNKVRSVKLEGEAYFEVAKDKKRPFLVSSKGQEIRVLGTHFNINGYADEGKVKTTLLEGSVLVSRSGGAQDQVLLKPNQQAILEGSRGITVREVDVNEAVAWKSGNFRFEDQSVTDIMKQIARWYDVDVEYEGDLSDIRLNASISRNRNISQLLKMMEKTNEVHFKIEGRKIIVKK